ncbi:MAG: SpoIID/LytB domain-containing protein [Bacilli bacterium]|nr:SpoIID/LytB domain-containing protein [Bacilli bacterium]
MAENNNSNKEIVNSNNGVNNLTSSGNEVTRKDADQKLDRAGSDALQKMGVPKSAADKAIKNNGGMFSPANLPGNKLVKNKSRDALSNVLNKNKNRFQNNNSNSNLNMNNDEENSNEKPSGDLNENKIQESNGFKKVLSNGLTNKIGGNLTGSIFGKVKTKIYLYLIAASIPVIFLFLIIILIAGGGEEEKSKADDYFSGEMSEEELESYLKSAGYCDGNDCSNALKYYKTIESSLVTVSRNERTYYANLVMAITGYGRKSNELFIINSDEIDEVAKKLVQLNYSSSTDLSKFNELKDYIVGENGYIDTFRPDLKDKKEKAYNAMIGNASKENKNTKLATKKKQRSNSNGSRCIYNVNGESQDIKVQLTECTNSASPSTPTVGSPMDLEDYVRGVLYAESCVNINSSYCSSNGWSIEVVKTHAVAIRSFVLAVNRNVGDATGEGLGTVTKGIARIQSCTNRQVYCSVDYGCSENSNRTMVPGTAGNILSGHFGPMTDSLQREILEQVITETQGKVLYDGSDIVPGSYDAWNGVPTWKKLANEGNNYNEILVKYYSAYRHVPITVATIGKCTSSNISDYDWKQTDPRWGSVLLGTGTANIHNIGCLLTSTAIQIARSGTEVTTPDFDPGVLGNCMRQAGAFGSNGALLAWAANKQHCAAPNFDFDYMTSATGSKSAISSKLASILSDSNSYVIISVNSGGHWVAVIDVNGSEVTIIDPWPTGYTSLWDFNIGGTGGQVAVFKKKD